MAGDSDDIFNDRFHWCALAAGFQALAEGRIGDSRYVRQLAYESYERGEFKDRVPRPPPRDV